ncbi:Putative transporter C530 [Scheffersomyces stipitis CBS 6054]|uniref:Putative transporter C530 n=1 Tax=Scheffersomyces stipitis (strain ATCC 58785 / CBS 6054 / NBRC 10063 / NRRL Y-11545) TaxID=322104 RepID=A3GHD8_PICST|nr:Putative transporter C530 [Scheffersomyces stipitis CBS 6054]EAZ62800.2 Putative transporter C530 [Scheffersomyces stipitis CBS 6054]
MSKEESFSEKSVLEEHQLELSQSSSNDSNEPIAFTRSRYEQHVEHQRRESNVSRRGSASSMQRSLDIIRRSLTGEIQHSIDSSNEVQAYTVKDIYGDLDVNEIALQRTATRTTILNELVQRTQEQEISSDEESDLEKQISNKYDEYDPEATLPETSIPIQNNGEEFNKIDPELITFNGPDDPEDPRNWPTSTKIVLVGYVSLYALVAPMSSSMLSPAMSDIIQTFNIKSETMAAMVVSIQILAWAFGPLIIAPLSEHDNIGRKIVLDVSCWMSLLFNIGCAFSQNTAQMMVCRFIGGLFGCVPMNVCAGVISDLFDAKSRNMALASYSLVPLMGPVIAPVVAGFIVENMQWRWVFYVLCFFNFAVALSATLFFKETYVPTLLKRRANKLRLETGNNDLHTIYEIADGETTIGRMTLCMVRPVKLLFTHPMIVGLGSFMAFTYGFMYLMIVTFPTIFGGIYGFDKGVTGLMYLPMGCGFILGVIIWTYLVGRTYNRLTEKNGGVPKPEYRLPCLFACSIIIPVGLVWFGWSTQKKLHWIMPGIGSAIFAFGLVCVFQTTQSYLIDMNPRYAASSVAAAALFRSLFGFSFPLFANLMYAKLGYGWANTMCAFIGLVLGVPFPIFSYIYGERIRNWANKRIEREQIKRDQKNLQRLQKKNLA